MALIKCVAFIGDISLIGTYSIVFRMSYEAISKLGEGGFGSVWKMRTPPNEPCFRSNKIVAMKRVTDPDEESYQEVEILKKLDNANIIKYLTSFTNECNDLCIIMRYC